MATSSITLLISLRSGLLPVMRYGNYAGPGYAGGLGAESTITDPSINNNQPILDSVTRNHDVEYTVAEMRFMTEVQTQLGHMHQLLAQGAGQGEISAELGAGAGGHAHAGNQADALQGNATEAADYKTQSYGALVVKVQNSEDVQINTQALQQLQDQQTEQRVAINGLYRDTEGNGYYEKIQWASGAYVKESANNFSWRCAA